MRNSCRNMLRLVLVPMLVGASGCQWGDRHTKAEEVITIEGLSVLESDGIWTHLEYNGDNPQGWRLRIAGQEVERIDLRVGQEFTMSNEREAGVTYRILLADPTRVTLKRTELIDKRASGGGVRAIENVVTLVPYNLKPRE